MKFNIPDKLHEAIAEFLEQVDEIKELPPGIPARAATQIEKGKITLFLSPNFNKWSDELKRNIIQHEASHVCLKHVERFRESGREYDALANNCCDAVLYQLGLDDAELKLKELGPVEGSCSTFETLGIPPMQAERAWDLLKQQREGEGEGDGEGGEQNQGGCGNYTFGKVDQSYETWEKLHELAIKVGGKLEGIGQRIRSAGRGRSTFELTGTIPPAPKWIRKTLQYLIDAYGRKDRKRSWRRFSRTGLECIPGRGMKQGMEVQIMLDSSVSVQDEMCLEFIAAISGTPEFAGATVRAFDSEPSGEIPASSVEGIRQAISQHRGGTCIRRAGETRKPGVPVIWLTDGMSCDGLPEPHDATEIWCIVGGYRLEGSRIVIEVGE